jgi:chemotaxis protein MotB
MSLKIKSLVYMFLLAVLVSGCVTAKKYEELEEKNDKCNQESEILKEETRVATIENTELKSKVDIMKNQLSELQKDSLERENKLRSFEMKYDRLNKSYGDLQQSQETLLKGNVDETRRILKELQTTQEGLLAKEDKLRKLEDNLRLERNNLDKLKKDIEAQNMRLVELETILNRKDSVVAALKDKVSKALLGFTNMGLAVETRNGKVYVSLEEQLLFKSGSTVVDPKGVTAIKKLAEVLEKNPDINIVVEGHTDDVPYIASESIKDNWDLSVKRATAIVRILMDGTTIEGSRINASGRSKYLPIDPSIAPDARRKNRRTEIILTPKLDELFQILESN